MECSWLRCKLNKANRMKLCHGLIGRPFHHHSLAQPTCPNGSSGSRQVRFALHLVTLAVCTPPSLDAPPARCSRRRTGLAHQAAGCRWLATACSACCDAPYFPFTPSPPHAQEFAPAHSTGPYAYSQAFPRLLPFLGWGVSAFPMHRLLCAVPCHTVLCMSAAQHQLHVPNKACTAHLLSLCSTK